MNISTTLQHQFIPTGSVTLHVVTAGPADGPPVVLLHGFPEFWGGWQAQIGALAAAGLRVIVPDQRGYNLSDRPRRVADYRLDALAGDVVGLLDSLGIERVFLAAHDWGAVVAWWTALRYPDRLRRMVILNGPHPAALAEELRSGWQQALKSWYTIAFQVPILPELAMSRGGMEQGLLATSRRGTFTPEMLARYRRAWLQPGARSGMLAWYRATFRHPPAPPADPTILVPTHVVWGRKDVFLGTPLAERSAALCTESRLTFIDKATHWVQHEAATEVNEIMVDWFTDPAAAP